MVVVMEMEKWKWSSLLAIFHTTVEPKLIRNCIIYIHKNQIMLHIKKITIASKLMGVLLQFAVSFQQKRNYFYLAELKC